MSDVIVWAGTLFSLLGILVPFIIWYSSIDKKLDRIIYRDCTLDLQQAEAIVTMYVIMIRYVLMEAISRFFEKELSDHDLREGGTVDTFVDLEVPDTLRNNRAKLQPFRLHNNVTVEQFLNENNPIESGTVKDARVKVVKLVKAGLQSHEANDELKKS